MTHSILVTGFEPFGTSSVNAAWEAVCRLPNRINGLSVITECIPTSYKRAAKTALRAASTCEPAVMLMVGQAGGRSEIALERVAINLADASSPDNDGLLLQNKPILPNGINAYFDTLDSYPLAKQLQDEGFPVRLSYSAGTYVCNHLFYEVLHATAHTPIKTGFEHVPCLPEQVAHDAPALPLRETVEALTRLCELIALGLK